MKRKIFTFIILFSLISSIQGFNSKAFSQQQPISSVVINDAPPYFKNVVFITWDGTNYKVLEDMIDWGLLPNTAKIDAMGYRQTIRITSHLTSTNPGLACMETGYGDEINMIPYNMFGYGTTKVSIPDNLTISERLKNSFGDDITTMFVYSWQTAEMDMTYINQDPNIDPIFDNMKPEVDMWFASENLTWTPDDPDARAATFHGFDEDTQLYISPVMNANYLGQVAADFLDNVTTDRFYLRIHLTEPDQAGHGYGVTDPLTGEYTEEYMQSLVESDVGTGYILDQLEAMGVMNDTLVIIGADHGMYDHGHDGGIWPENTNEITTNTFIISNDSVRHPLNAPACQRDIAPTILASMGVDTLAVDPPYIRADEVGIPFWEIDDTTPPNLKKVWYKTEGTTLMEVDENTTINEICTIELDIFDWCDDLTGVLKVGDLEFNSFISSFKKVKWSDVDLTSLESGTVTLNFTVTDAFGNSANFLQDLKVNIIDTTEPEESPFSIWFSIISVLAVGTILYLKKKRI